MNEPSDEFFWHALGMGVGVWSGCGGGGVAVAVAAGRGWLRFVLSFDVVVDVPVVQVVDWDCPALGQGCLARYNARQGFWSRQCSPWSSAVAVLGQGVDMPVVVQRQVCSLRVDVVDTPVVAQVQIPMVPLRFSSCSTLIRWSSCVVQVLQILVAVCEKTVEIPQLQAVSLGPGC